MFKLRPLTINSPKAAEAVERWRAYASRSAYFLERIGKPPNHAILLLADQPLRKIVANFIALTGVTEKIERLSSVVLSTLTGSTPAVRIALSAVAAPAFWPETAGNLQRKVHTIF